MIPREHGAWSMLIQPFLCAWILSGQWHWTLVPAALAILAAFVIREPLVILGRQKYVWREPKPESQRARKWAAGTLLVMAICGALLIGRWPLEWMVVLGGAACALTALAVFMTVKNRQRSTWLQMLSAAGLTSSAFVACLSAIGSVPAWCWWLWAISAAHAFAGILVVHARLEARIAAKAKSPVVEKSRRPATLVQFALLAGAAACLLAGHPIPAAALVLSAAVHLIDLRRLDQAEALQTPLVKVGLRAMALSMVISALVVAGFWGESSHSSRSVTEGSTRVAR